VIIAGSADARDDVSAMGLSPVGSGGDGDGAGAGLLLGSTVAHAAELRDLMTQAGAVLYVTVGLREWAPLRAYRAPQRPYAAATPTVRYRRLAGAERWRIAPLTVRGLSESGALLYADAATIRDDILALTEARDELWARYGTQRGRASWRLAGELAHDLRPGAAVASVVLPGRTVAIAGHVSLITWDATLAGWGTEYIAAPLAAGAEDV